MTFCLNSRHCEDIPLAVRLIWLILSHPAISDVPEGSTLVFIADSVPHDTPTEHDDGARILAELVCNAQPAAVRDLLFGVDGSSLQVLQPFSCLGKFSSPKPPREVVPKQENSY